MKKWWTAALLTALLVSCGEDDAKPKRKPPVARKSSTTARKTSPAPRYTRSASFDDHLNVISDPENREQKPINIRRLPRVSHEEYPRVIAYLESLINSNNATNAERAAALSALIDIGTDEALVTVKKQLLFGTNGHLRLTIIESLKKKFVIDYKKIIAGWAADVLNESDVMEKYNVRDIASIISMFATVNGSNNYMVVQVQPLLASNNKDIIPRAYGLLFSYPEKEIPFEYLSERLAAGFETKKVLPVEVQLFGELLHRKKLPEDYELDIDYDHVEWGLKSGDPEMRKGTILLLKPILEELGLPDMRRLKSALENTAANDPYLVEGSYPVREAAAAALKELNL